MAGQADLMDVFVVLGKHRFSDEWVLLQDRGRCGYLTRVDAQSAADAMTQTHGPEWEYRVVPYGPTEQ